MSQTNINPAELQKFDGYLDAWWDLAGPADGLHKITPLRILFIEKFVNLTDAKVLDVGCGGGILSEAMARRGADVFGIDASKVAVGAARGHAGTAELAVRYDVITAEDLCSECSQKYDLITCVEMLEHVPDPKSVIKACSQMLAPGGTIVLSTIDRTLVSWLSIVAIGEWVLRLLPVGTHTYRGLIRKDEMIEWAQSAGLRPKMSRNLHYNPFSGQYALSEGGPRVIYLCAFQKV